MASGACAACVVLSGTGADGSAGLAAIRDHGGFVVAQDPDEAAYGGMPRSAIETGRVDVVLPAADIPAALAEWGRHATVAGSAGSDLEPPELQAILDLLRSQTGQDFSLYKRGTLQRRVERRMAQAAAGSRDMGHYLQRLRRSRPEREALAKDLLIHVTSFFRDPGVFALLAETTLPELVRRHPPDRPIRIWVAGCSTGEETYSLAMLLLEAIGRSGQPTKLQVFASDVDPEAVATARDGLYPEAAASVGAERLAHFFTREESGWRVAPDLRAVVVFTVQDVLADPPFSRLDLVSCRNLLIYLRPEAQEKVISLFHFALRDGGLLLLGTAETAGGVAGRFEVVAEAERLYRRVGHGRPDGQRLATVTTDGLRLRPAAASVGARAPSRQLALAELGRRLVLDAYAPAAVLINGTNECLFSLGAADRFLRLAPGQPSHDLLAMARPGLRAKLHSAIDLARRDRALVPVTCRVARDAAPRTVSIEVHPVLEAGEELLLVCFVERTQEAALDRLPTPRAPPQVAELERELDATRTELQGAIRDLERSGEEQRAINEEALSVNEEYQSTNEELLASKEELQSLNEELTALNSQLQETLERQRTTSDDLQNVLYSTNVATLFLDRDLRIRFFTPATRALFAILPGDLGRPLADLHSLAADGALERDARAVLADLDPTEREIEAEGGAWFRRRVLPYRAHDGAVEGVVITFTDITARKRAANALEEAKRQADLANVAKSRFLAAASHDLRQPLQTLALLQGLLAKAVRGDPAQNLVVRLDDTLGAMGAMLNTLLDINQIEAGVVQPEVGRVPMAGLLDRMRDEFSYHARAKGLELRIAACSEEVRSDPRLLEQMLRNLLSNALKYTKRGKILVGCRRHGTMLSVQVWDTGIGIPPSEFDTIFEEYRQIDNAARERSRGLGLGLSIVQRLGTLLGHRIGVHSRHGEGSGFTIEVPLAHGDRLAARPATAGAERTGTPDAARPGAAILVVEDDPDLRELLGLLLEGEGHRVATAADGPAALALALDATAPPDLLLADFNLPGGLNGLQLADRIRRELARPVPAIILTGDISAATAREVARGDCVQLDKPVKRKELMQAVATLLSAVTPRQPSDLPGESPWQGVAATDQASKVFVVDDDDQVRAAIRLVLEAEGQTVEDFASGEAFLRAHGSSGDGCLLIDAYLPGMDGLELLRRLRAGGSQMPAIMITGRSDVPMAVQAMKAGASDFIEKPVGADELLAGIERALEQSRDRGKLTLWRERAAGHVASLTPRQRQVMALVVAGHPSKNIAADLGISQRTVENHRASIMHKTGSASLPALARLAFAAAWDEASVPAGSVAQPAE